MPLRYLLDEHFTGTLDKALRRHNAHALYPVEYVGIGDPKDLPKGSRDRYMLLWAERENLHRRVRRSEDDGAGFRCPPVLGTYVPRLIHRSQASAAPLRPRLTRDCRIRE